MANTVSGFYQTLVAAANEASQALVYNLNAVDSIYWDHNPNDPQAIGQVINVPIPNIRTSGVVDAGVADMALVDAGATTTAITLNKHPQDAFVIRNFEQFNSARTLRTAFLDAAIKGVKENINAAVTALFTTGNFNVNSAIATTGHLVTTAQFLSGMAVLSDARVPVTDTENMSLLLPSLPYTAVLGDSNWTQAQIAGMSTAETVRATGRIPTAYGTTVKLDQQMPTTGSAPTRSFTGCYLHRWAIAGVTRPLPQPSNKVVDYTYIDFGGIPILVSLGYNQYPKQGWIVSVEAGYGLAVVRPSMGQIYTIAE